VSPELKAVRIALAVIAYLALSACSEEEPGPIASPSSQFIDATGATGAASGGTGATGATSTGATGATGGLPTTSPAAGTGNLTEGEVTFTLSGDVRLTRTLDTLISAVYTQPPGGLAIVWAAGGLDATVVGIGGASFTGTRATAPTLTITITAQLPGGGLVSLLSIDGECSVTLDVAGANALSGSFACDDLVSSAGETVDATGTFEATG
jgi:hypothetical protein